MECGATAEQGVPVAMTIAGFDPGSGAGITADLLTLAQHGIFATSAITVLTVQSTLGVRKTEPVGPELLRQTLDELEADLPPDGIKIGALGGAAQAGVVADYLALARRRRPFTVVLDPVLRSSSGAALLDAEGLVILRERLLPLADAVTPNAVEAALLTGQECATRVQAEACGAWLAQRYLGLTPIITGGHLPKPGDLVWADGQAEWMPALRISSRATHGTGCVFSSALLAARLGGASWAEAAGHAAGFVAEAVRRAPERGAGRGPTYLVGRGRAN